MTLSSTWRDRLLKTADVSSNFDLTSADASLRCSSQTDTDEDRIRIGYGYGQSQSLCEKHVPKRTDRITSIARSHSMIERCASEGISNVAARALLCTTPLASTCIRSVANNAQFRSQPRMQTNANLIRGRVYFSSFRLTVRDVLVR